MGGLPEAAVAHYREHGYYAPIRVMPAAEAEGFAGALKRMRQLHGVLKGSMRHKSHLLFTWLDGLIRHPAILDAVEGVIGPDILCWSSTFFIKEARDPGFVSWHQDSTYWGLDPADIVTAWVALSESTAENGAMRVIPDTHKLEQVAHRDTFAANNLLTRGQEIAVDVDGGTAVMLSLAARRDVASPCSPDPWIGSQPFGKAPDRLCHSLPSDPCPAGRRNARQCNARSRRRSVRQFRAGVCAGRTICPTRRLRSTPMSWATSRKC